MTLSGPTSKPFPRESVTTCLENILEWFESLPDDSGLGLTDKIRSILVKTEQDEYFIFPDQIPGTIERNKEKELILDEVNWKIFGHGEQFEISKLERYITGVFLKKLPNAASSRHIYTEVWKKHCGENHRQFKNQHETVGRTIYRLNNKLRAYLGTELHYKNERWGFEEPLKSYALIIYRESAEQLSE